MSSDLNVMKGSLGTETEFSGLVSEVCFLHIAELCGHSFLLYFCYSNSSNLISRPNSEGLYITFHHCAS